MAKNNGLGDGEVDWNDPAFTSTGFDDAMMQDGSPYGASSANAFDAYTNMNDFVDSPPGLTMRNFTTAPTHHMNILSTRSAGSSSQDSASDTSSSRKRKTTSESPESDAQDNSSNGKSIRKAVQGDKTVDMADMKKRLSPSSHLDMTRALHGGMAGPNALFDFNSAASSPINPGAFDAALSLDEQVHGFNMQLNQGFSQPSPLQTINPANFQLDTSRDQQPSNMLFGSNASPTAVFSTPSSETNEFNVTQGWHPSMAATNAAAWTNDFNSAAHFSPTSAMNFTPSPTSGGLTMAPTRKGPARPGRSGLHIAPISAKSRVETQISIIMTLETPPPKIEYLHLPLQTIAKSKLLAKEEVDPTKVLELHTMLVCTSAMRKPSLKAKALRRAATQNNLEIQQRAEAQRNTGDEDKNDPKNVPEEDRPSNGGEVRICNNCIQRERKRAARKKLKKEEEQQHWERYETERVVVFNSSELLPFKPWEAVQLQKEGSLQDDYFPPEGAMQVSAAMRIACYCRHQNEKEGFQVIFTLKDSEGNVVAQEMSDSILITDDHKTHQPSFTSQMGDQVLFGAGNPNSAFAQPALPTSYSMVDMSQHVQPGFTSSKSAGNLQALAYSQFGGHMHQMQGPFSTNTSASVTPTNSLSRPGSPTSAGHSGPNKKRKSSSFHRRVPSGLTMTPRVDTGVPPTSAAQSAVSAMSQFLPTTPGGTFQQPDQLMMGNGPQYFGSGPPTPSDSLHHVAQQLAQGNHSRNNTQQIPDYYQSLPGSRVNSRAPSPVMQSTRSGTSAFPRRPSGHSRQQIFSPQQLQQQQPPQQQTPETEPSLLPAIHKITPTEGPVAGGTEVSIYGRDFAQGMQVFFGDQPATAVTFYGEQALLCTSPPGRVGGVQVSVLPAGHLPQYDPTQLTRPVFTYKNANEKVMEMALRFVSQQQTGNSGAWWQVTQQNATRWMQQTINRNNGAYPSGAENNMMAFDSVSVEKFVSTVIDVYDAAGLSDATALDAPLADGQTCMTLACAAGLQESVRCLLIRGAHPDAADMHGFTPLMHAALHGQLKVFHMLMTRGADISIRSLAGHSAFDVAPPAIRPSLQQIAFNTPRTRLRPGMGKKRSNGSFASSKTSWDISSASMYESEDWCSSRDESPSRRLSTASPFEPFEAIAEDDDDDDSAEGKQDGSTIKNCAPLPAAMLAVRETLALQLQHFHQTLQHSMLQLHIAIRPLTNLDEPQDNAVLRKLATMVHTLNEAFPYLPTAPLGAVLPPAYSELYPENVHVTSDGIDFTPKRRAPITTKSKGSANSKPCEVDVLNKFAGSLEETWMLSQLVFWLCVPLLVVLTAVTVHAFGARAGQPKVQEIASRVVEVF